ncbi:MAG: dockerin type I repeat-containing protein [Ruminococcus sp.]|nr:dockerin type I repeat-containing protein [Ruminococcus sp.]
MNKKIIGVLSALLCLCPMKLTNVNLYAYSFTQAEIENSETKPTLSFPQINIPIDKAKENPEVTVSLTISGADEKYSTAEIWTSFDSRLSIKTDSEDNYFKLGNALKNLNIHSSYSSYYDMAKGSIVDLNGIRIIAAGGGNDGLDGVLFTTTLILPDNVQEGDIFELKTVRMTRENSNNDFVNSIFTNIDDDKAGKLMGEWLFTNGIKNGCIKITGEQEINYGDANLDGDVTVSDAVYILQHLANSEKYPLDGQAAVNADVYNTGDGVTANDASSIQRFDAGVITSLPESKKE